jgi:hypothetical protein
VSGTQPSSAPPSPGSGPPVPSEPARSPPPPGLGGNGWSGRSGPGAEPTGPASRVVLVSRDPMLASALESLIEAPGWVTMLDWRTDELEAALRHADVVILDMPPSQHRRTFVAIAGRFLGRTIVLLQESEREEDLPAGPPWVVLYRPLQMGDLWAAITGTGPFAPPPPPPEAATPGPGDATDLPASPEDTGAEPEPAVDLRVDAGVEADAVQGGEGDAVDAEDGGEPPPSGESGQRPMIGLSGRELEPVIGPGQVAPGMDAATLERVRGWASRIRKAPAAEPRPETGSETEAPRRRERRSRARLARGAARARRARDRRARFWRRLSGMVAGLAGGVGSGAAATARATGSGTAGLVRCTGSGAVWLVRGAGGGVARLARGVGGGRVWVARWVGGGVVGLAGGIRRDVVGLVRGTGRSAVWLVGALGRLVVWMVRPAAVVVLAGTVGLLATGWRGQGGPDTLAGEVALAQVADSPAGGALLLPDPGIGPLDLLHTLAVRSWLRLAGTEAGMDELIRAARTPSHLLLAAVAALTVLLSLLLTRVGPGTGAAAGPGPAPPHAARRTSVRTPRGNRCDRGAVRRRMLVASVVGLLVALDPLLVRTGRVATGTVLALALALATLAVAWALPPRPAWRWLPAVGAGSGLALLASPLALPVLLAPAATALLQRRWRAAGQAMAALGLGAALWLCLPVWLAGQGIGDGAAGWLLGRPPGRGSLAASLAASPLSWLLAGLGVVAAAWSWRRRGDQPGPAAARVLGWVAATAAGALAAIALGYPVEQALPFALPAAATALALAVGNVGTATPADTGTATPADTGTVTPAGARTVTPAGAREVGSAWRGGSAGGVAGRAVAVAALTVVGLVVAQGLDWAGRYRGTDDGLDRLVELVEGGLPDCSAVNASGPDDRARLLAAGVTVTEFSSVPAAKAVGVRYFVLTDAAAAARGGPTTPAMAAWIRQHGNRLADLPSQSFSRVQLWQVEPAALDPVAEHLPVPGGVFSNVTGSACGGFRVLDSDLGTFHAAYQALGGKAVLGRPLGSVWSSDGPALQAFDTMLLGAVPSTAGKRPSVRPADLLLLLAKLDPRGLEAANMPLPSGPPPPTDAEARVFLNVEAIARVYLGTDPAGASPDDWRRATDRFGRPLGMPRVMRDGAVRQPFERVVIELPADGGPARLAPLGQLALRLGVVVPQQARRPEPVPGLPARAPPTRAEPGPFLRLLAAGIGLLALGAAVGALAGRKHARGHTGTTSP